MSWLAVDKNGQEWIFDKKPYRRKTKQYLSKELADEIQKLNPELDTDDLYILEETNWGIKPKHPITKDDYSVMGPLEVLFLFSCKLPRGSIKKLIGKDLTWADEPVELE